jgi:DNA repair protein RecN (Recombination protein N)
MLRAVARKYGVEVKDLDQFLLQMKEKLQLLSDDADNDDVLATKVVVAKAHFLSLSEILHQKRLAAAEILKTKVMQELTALKMQQTRFEAEVLTLDENLWGELGIDKVQFIASTNPGTPMQPIAKIASGGELSRFMLALKVALSHVKSVPTLVFDEVDTGIGGAVADAVGRRLALLGKHLQVLVVTHQPQVASKGAYHLKVSKHTKGESTTTQVMALSAAERQEELARMLAGEEITSEARAAAGKLLQTEEV